MGEGGLFINVSPTPERRKRKSATRTNCKRIKEYGRSNFK